MLRSAHHLSSKQINVKVKRRLRRNFFGPSFFLDPTPTVFLNVCLGLIARALQEIWFQKLLKRFDDEVRMGRFLCVQALYSISLFGFTLAKS